jgi:D-glycero-beta-D-manno-heptose 1-phosphate adenylyltransferase
MRQLCRARFAVPLCRSLADNHAMLSIHSKQMTLAAITALPRPLVLTNGVFDILHRGHVLYLEQAAALGASLVVAINSDASARGLGKAPDRPLNAEHDRLTVIAALASVSAVCLFAEHTPVELIKLVKPDVYVKGGDYDMELLEETRVVRGWGGKSVALNFVDGYSTTATVAKIRSAG